MIYIEIVVGLSILYLLTVIWGQRKELNDAAELVDLYEGLIIKLAEGLEGNGVTLTADNNDKEEK